MAYAVKAFSTVITIESIALIISHSVLRQNYRDDLSAEIEKKQASMSNHLIEVIEKKLAKQGEEIIKQVSEYILNIKELNALGLSNIEKSLDLQKIFETQRNFAQGLILLQRVVFLPPELKLLDEWIPYLVMKYNKSIQILMLLPIENGNADEGVTNGFIQTKQIFDLQLKKLSTIKDGLPKGFKEKLQVKVRQSHTIESLTGYNDKLINNKYLDDYTFDEGIYIEAEGKNTKYYKDWLLRFQASWSSASIMSDLQPQPKKPGDNPGQNSKIGNKMTLKECLRK